MFLVATKFCDTVTYILLSWRYNSSNFQIAVNKKALDKFSPTTVIQIWIHKLMSIGIWKKKCVRSEGFESTILLTPILP